MWNSLPILSRFGGSGQNPHAGLLVIHNRHEIVIPHPTASRLLNIRWHLPGSMDVLIQHNGQLQHPAAYIDPNRVKFVPLRDGVEHPEVGRGSHARAGRPLPTAIVGGCLPRPSFQNTLGVGINVEPLRPGITHQGHTPLLGQLHGENVRRSERNHNRHSHAGGFL